MELTIVRSAATIFLLLGIFATLRWDLCGRELASGMPLLIGLVGLLAVRLMLLATGELPGTLHVILENAAVSLIGWGVFRFFYERRNWR
jgi:hypothetical protein